MCCKPLVIGWLIDWLIDWIGWNIHRLYPQSYISKNFDRNPYISAVVLWLVRNFSCSEKRSRLPLRDEVGCRSWHSWSVLLDISIFRSVGPDVVKFVGCLHHWRVLRTSVCGMECGTTLCSGLRQTSSASLWKQLVISSLALQTFDSSRLVLCVLTTWSC